MAVACYQHLACSQYLSRLDLGHAGLFVCPVCYAGLAIQTKNQNEDGFDNDEVRDFGLAICEYLSSVPAAAVMAGHEVHLPDSENSTSHPLERALIA